MPERLSYTSRDIAAIRNAAARRRMATGERAQIRRTAPVSGPIVEDVPSYTRKEDAPCCVAATDADGRPPIGFCGPDCIRRAERERMIAERDGTPPCRR